MLTPQIGLVYANASRTAYSDSAVPTPITFERFTIERVSATVGPELRGELIAKLRYRLAATGEKDISNSIDNFAISGSFGIASFQGLERRHSWRFNGSTEVSYEIVKNFSLFVTNSIRPMYDTNGSANVVAGGRKKIFDNLFNHIAKNPVYNLRCLCLK